MKKLFSVLLAVLLAFSGICGVFAKEEDCSPDTIELEMPEGGLLVSAEYDENLSEYEPVRKRGSLKPFTEYFTEQLLAHTESIDISSYQFTDNISFHNMAIGIIISNYQVMSYAHYRYVTNAGKVMVIKPYYILDSLEEDNEARAFMADQIKTEYIDKVKDIPNSDIVGKVLVIHDLFCKNNVYAKQELEEDPNNNDIRTAYWLFKYNRAVCQGNAIALKGIFDALNAQLKKEEGTEEDFIKAGLCDSAKKKHIWNVVKIDGKWYHIDETWDDPPSVDTGYARHEYFLRSDAQMSDHIADVKDWIYYADEPVICDDTKYEGEYIFNAVDGSRKELGQLITYEDGRYRLEIEYVGKEYPFWTDSLKATRVLATDAYDEEAEGVKRKVIKFFSKDAVNMAGYCVRNSTSGSIESLSKMSISKNKVFLNLKYTAIGVARRVFIWSEDGIEPLCRVIDIPADTQ